jgi:hypothetical protein
MFLLVSLECGSLSIKKQARVVRLIPAQSNAWLLGCAFTGELTPGELNTLVS